MFATFAADFFESMNPVSYISNAHPEFIESLYSDFRNDPNSVDLEWKKFFDGFEFAIEKFGDDEGTDQLSPDEFKVWNLIQSYRQRGHLVADTNPIRQRKDRRPNLELGNHGLSNSDLGREFVAGNELGIGTATLEKIIAELQKIYTGKIGFEFDYNIDPAKIKWFRDRVEKQPREVQFSIDKKKHILGKLNQTVVFEKFLHTKYIGQKRFSLEGGESTIPALDAVINKGAELGVKEFVIGMAHRGRLNVLANILGKTYNQIFSEFEGNAEVDTTMGDGDVKYHLGFASQVETTSGKKVDLKLAPNPSHLEAVNPVVEGFARAKADILHGSEYDKILPILIHGDAALAGQGVVYELLQMSKLNGYKTGGTIHLVINNQIGFTTDFDDARSSFYSTSIAGIVHAPVLHVNGDEIESVVWAMELATEFRQTFNSDIFIDILCYRRHGHNEGDEPKFTQPGLYKIIENHPDPREIYSQKLIANGAIEEELANSLNKSFWSDLQDRLDLVRQEPLPYEYQEHELLWKSLRKSTAEDFDQSPETAISERRFDLIFEGITHLPEEFQPLRKAKRILAQTAKLNEENVVDWATAELMAYGSILLEGNDVRISGQDVKRGTFAHRHAVMYDAETSAQLNRLNNLQEQQGHFMIYNSLLSEFAVLGFEFGYSLASPNTLTIWEAQFGDFSNGAQTIIDQFIMASETKWQRMSGLVMLLPHGYEGQGPEHSSARLERFLQGCAEYNIGVVNCTTPANLFHVLRRQQERDFRKPLVIMSPKSMLRHPKVISPIEEFLTGNFREIITGDNADSKKKLRKVIFCSGKIFYDLDAHREENKVKDIAIFRMEQLYPIPEKQIADILKKHETAEVLWVQEEPANMGAWSFIATNLSHINWQPICRKASASPATGFYKIHAAEQREIIESAFA